MTPEERINLLAFEQNMENNQPNPFEIEISNEPDPNNIRLALIEEKQRL